jgi:hypothetical protein
LTRLLGWIVAACLAAAYLLKPSPDSVTDKVEKQAIRAADSLHVDLKLRLGSVRLATDSVLVADTTFRADTVTAIVQRERSACDAVLSACEARVAARDTRIKTLEARQAGWLHLYADAGVLLPGGLPVGARFDAEGGIALRLDRQTQVQAGATSRGDVRISVRRQVKLF